jgi:CheY-like chemotaxis protein
LEWLLKSFPSGTTSFSELIDPALKAVQPLMQNLGKRIECQIPDDLPAVNGHLTAMRQAIMNILLAGLPVIPAEVLIVQVSAQSQEIFVQLHSAPSTLLQEESCNPELVGMAEKFSNLFNGRLEIHANPFSAQLILPVVQQIPIVVIDDNTDVLHLLQRYVTGSAFRFYGFSQPGLAIEEVMEIDPQVIVMDVMMPGMDDWELLGRLRSHPATSAIPIIVCTILPQDQLAFTLGASGFLRKPVSRQAFLAELERLTIHASPKPS